MKVMPGLADETDPFVGSGLAEDINSLAGSLADGDWVEGSLHGVGIGFGVAGAVLDPVAAATATVAGLAMEHLDPLRSWLDELGGDPDAVMADSALLDDAGVRVGVLAEEVVATSMHRLGEMEGLAVEACREFVRASGRDAAHLSMLLRAGADAMRLAAGIVDGVRTMLRDAIAEVIGMATSSAVTVAISGGLAAPAVLARVSVRVQALALRLGRLMKAMKRSFEALRQLLARAESALRTLLGFSARRRPRHVIPEHELPVWFDDQLAKRLLSIRPVVIGAETSAGAAATVVAGPDG